MNVCCLILNLNSRSLKNGFSMKKFKIKMRLKSKYWPLFIFLRFSNNGWLSRKEVMLIPGKRKRKVINAKVFAHYIMKRGLIWKVTSRQYMAYQKKRQLLLRVSTTCTKNVNYYLQRRGCLNQEYTKNIIAPLQITTRYYNSLLLCPSKFCFLNQ